VAEDVCAERGVPFESFVDRHTKPSNHDRAQPW
jgi:hypothetical protein